MHSPDPAAASSFTPRPEQIFFPDPSVDRAMGILMALATEVYVLRDRQLALERMLAAQGIVDLAQLDAEPAPAVLGVQASKGVAA